MVKNLPTNAGGIMRCGFNPWVKKILWRREWQPTLCLENFMDKGAWQASVHGVANSKTGLSNEHTHTHTHTRPINNVVIALDEH